jgi:hypothetical protein
LDELQRLTGVPLLPAGAPAAELHF